MRRVEFDSFVFLRYASVVYLLDDLAMKRRARVRMKKRLPWDAAGSVIFAYPDLFWREVKLHSLSGEDLVR